MASEMLSLASVASDWAHKLASKPWRCWVCVLSNWGLKPLALRKLRWAIKEFPKMLFQMPRSLYKSAVPSSLQRRRGERGYCSHTYTRTPIHCCYINTTRKDITAGAWSEEAECLTLSSYLHLHSLTCTDTSGLLRWLWDEAYFGTRLFGCGGLLPVCEYLNIGKLCRYWEGEQCLQDCT